MHNSQYYISIFDFLTCALMSQLNGSNLCL